MEQARPRPRPKAHVFRVDTLLQHAQRGVLRVPDFQRPLRWQGENVLELFDSIYRGIPIGSLLLFRGPAKKEFVHFGPYSVEAPAKEDAYFVLDGQQRLAALVGALLHPDPIPHGDIHSVWFDAVERRFILSRRAEALPQWVPLNVVSDSWALMKWFGSWPFQSQRPDLAKEVAELGTLIKEYEVPSYIVEGLATDELRSVFVRINTAGIPLEESEIFEALSSGDEPRPMANACARLQTETGFGEFSPNWFLRCLKVVEGTKVSSAAPRLAIERTEKALRHAISFLREEAGIIHSQLMPHRLPLMVLARFFHIHPNPHARTRTLLARWVWRGWLGVDDSRAHAHTVRRLASEIDENEFDSVERLLRAVAGSYHWPTSLTRWRGTSAETRLCALAMAHMNPRDPETGVALRPESLRQLLEERGLGDAFVSIGTGAHAVAERFLLADPQKLYGLWSASHEILQSHALDAQAIEAWAEEDYTSFARHRGRLLDAWFQRFFADRCALGESDRPPIAELVRRVEAQVARP